MFSSLRTIILQLVLLQAAFVTTYGTIISIGVVLDVAINQTSMTEAINRVTERIPTQTSGTDLQIRVDVIPLNSTSPQHAADVVLTTFNTDILGLVTVLRCPQRKVISTMSASFRIPHLPVDVALSHSDDLQFTVHQPTEHDIMAEVLVDIVTTADLKQIVLFSNGQTVKQDFLVQLISAGISTVLFSSNNTTIPCPASSGAAVVITDSNPWRQIDDIKLWCGYLTRIVFVNEDMRPGNTQSRNILLVKAKPSLTSASRGPILENSDELEKTERRVVQAVLLFWKCFVQNQITNATKQNILHPNQFNNVTEPNGSFSAPHYNQPYKETKEVLRCLKTMCSGGEISSCGNKARHPGYDLYGGLAGPLAELARVGEWSVVDGLKLFRTTSFLRLFLNEHTDFDGVTLRIVIIENRAPFVSLHPHDNGSYHGLIIDMLEDLADVLNFRYVLVPPEDGQFGLRLPDGSWSGIIGMVSRKEADLGASPITVNAERAQVVDFTTPFLQDSLGILTPTEQRQVPGHFQIFKPFSPVVWCAILTSLVTLCAVFAAISVTISSRVNKNSKQTHALLEMSVTENAVLIISSFFEQGPTFHPRSVSSRCLLTFWLVFTLLTTSMYTAHLAAVLTVSSPVRPINSVQDLLRRPDMEIRVPKGGSSFSFINQSTRADYKAIAARMKPVKNPYSDPDELISVSTLGDSIPQRFVASKSCGKLRRAEENINAINLGFALPPKSPYKEGINYVIQKMVESGLMDRLLRKWLRPRLDCPRPDHTEDVRGLKMDTVAGIFIVYGGVSLVAGCVLMLQLCLCRHQSCVLCHEHASPTCTDRL